MMTEQDFVLVDNYVDGTLPEPQKREVALRLKKDKDFAYEVRVRKEINEAILDNDVEAFRQNVKAIMNSPWWKKLIRRFFWIR